MSVARQTAGAAEGASARLVDDAGNVRVGIFAAPIDEVNHRDFVLTDPFGRPRGRLARHFAFNQFQFLGALGEDLVFGCAVADLKVVGTAFVYCYDPRTRRFDEHSFKRLLARGVRCDQRPESGTCTFESRRCRIAMVAGRAPRARGLTVEIAGGPTIDAVFDEESPPLEPMRICTPAGATGWVYARKTAGHRLSGTLAWEGRRYDLGALAIRGHHDWSAGFMRRHTFWNWACLAGRVADGRVVGLNVSCGVNETSFTENCFWVDGRLHKIDTVAFDYDRRDLMRPWRLRSFDGRLALDFAPEGAHAERVNAGIVASNFNQLFGRYRGRLTTAGGDTLTIAGMLGYAESHYAKW
jgi:hypothetical protein